MSMKVRSYKRKPYRLQGKVIHPGRTGTYTRKQRPKAKKRFIGSKVYAVKRIYDEYGQIRGTKWIKK